MHFKPGGTWRQPNFINFSGKHWIFKMVLCFTEQQIKNRLIRRLF